MEILLNTFYRHWYQGIDSYSIGYAFWEEKLLSEKELCVFLKQYIGTSEFVTILKRLNGSFAAIIKNNNEYYLVADQLGSYPLLYGIKNGECYISDNASDLKKYYQKETMNDMAIAEFLSMGYLSDNKTLFDHIKIVEAGSFIILSNTAIQKVKYHSHIYPIIRDKSDKELITCSVEIIEDAFKKILRTIKGKQIVIPLSGGYDSRLIACLCKKWSVDNVICYTYGNLDSFEVEVSKKVARTLGLKWFFVEYTKEKWLRLCNSSIFKDYQYYAGNLNTVPCIQDFLAIYELKQKEIIDAEAVVIPGHSADLLGGSHLSFRTINVPLHQLIYEKYYGLNKLKGKYQRMLQKELKDSLHGERNATYWDLFNDWGIRVRQSHFIVNSVRVYEFFNLNWRLPFWDNDFSKFWNSIPWEKKVNSCLFHSFLFEEYFEVFGVDFRKPLVLQKKDYKFYLRKVIPTILLRYLKYIRNQYVQIEMKEDSNLFCVLTDFYNLKKQYPSNYLLGLPQNVNGALAIEYYNLLK